MPDDVTPKRPASQYYWGDWWKDKGLHSCGLAARGLWHEMNCLMHEGEPYGHLTLNGRPMTCAQLANQCRITPTVCNKLVEELLAAGVPSVAPDTGAMYSRRMVRDEAIRNARAAGGKAGAEHGFKGAEHGAKGGRPSGSKGGSVTPLNGYEKPPPSSSSSPSGISIGLPLPEMDAVGGAAQSPASPPPPFRGETNVQAIPKSAIVPLAGNWELPTEWGTDAEALGFSPPEILRESEKFRQYWVSGKGAGSRKTLRGWRQAWSNWLAKAEPNRRIA